ncbi:hypothetical protein D920_00293, partial [Enterococcus faecalis 13-SD-W-01]
GVVDLFLAVGSGGTAAPVVAALTGAEIAIVAAATIEIGKHASSVMQNSLQGNNYSSSNKNRR